MNYSVNVPVVLSDIDKVLDFYHTDQEFNRTNVANLVNNIETWNILHGIYILRKLISVPRLELPRNFCMAVILHDVVKYKSQPEVVDAIFNHLLGEGVWYNVFRDHGIASGFLIPRILENPSPEDTTFLFFHSKTTPWHLDPEKIPMRDLIFYIIDDIVKGVKLYRFTMNKDDYEEVKFFLNCPRIQDAKRTFNILKAFKLDEKE